MEKEIHSFDWNEAKERNLTFRLYTSSFFFIVKCICKSTQTSSEKKCLNNKHQLQSVFFSKSELVFFSSLSTSTNESFNVYLIVDYDDENAIDQSLSFIFMNGYFSISDTRNELELFEI